MNLSYIDNENKYRVKCSNDSTEKNVGRVEKKYRECRKKYRECREKYRAIYILYIFVYRLNISDNFIK